MTDLITYRVLDPSLDSKIFFEIMMHFEEYETNVSNRPYSNNDIEKKVSLYIDAFTETNRNKFIVVGEFNNGQLISIATGYTYQLLWKSENNFATHWVLGLVYSKKKNNVAPTEKIHMLTDVLAKEFEKLQFCSFYMITKLPNMLSYDTWQEYLETLHDKNYQQNRYFAYLDRIIDSQEKIDSCRITSLKDILPKVYKKKLAVWQYLLKPECKSESFLK
jgi:hypothetical protein